MKPLFCSCRSCRRGLRNPYWSKKVQLLKRGARHRAKQQLDEQVKKGREDREPETRVYVGYTD